MNPVVWLVTICVTLFTAFIAFRFRLFRRKVSPLESPRRSRIVPHSVVYSILSRKSFINKRKIYADFEDVVKGCDFILVLYTAGWCTSCRYLTSTLASVYKELKRLGKGVEVIYLPGDRNVNAMLQFMHACHGDWYSLDFKDPDKRLLRMMIGFEGSSGVAVLRPDGSLVCLDGADHLKCYGAQSWAYWAALSNVPLNVLHILGEEELMTRDRSIRRFEHVIANCDIFMLFFDTLNFTYPEFSQQFRSVCEQLKSRGKRFEVIFVSGDRTREDMEQCMKYHGEWHSVQWRSPIIQHLELRLRIHRRPAIVVLKKDGAVVSYIGEQQVAYLSTGAWLSWTQNPKLVVQDAVTSILSESKVTKMDGTSKSIDSAMKDCEITLFLFSSYSCAECQSFVPLLAEVYLGLKQSKKIELIYVTMDSDEGIVKFMNDFQVDWYTLRCDDVTMFRLYRWKKLMISKVPTLAVLQRNADVLTCHGFENITTLKSANAVWDCWTADLPFLLRGRTLEKRDGSVTNFDAILSSSDLIVFYFSSHRGSDCREFTEVMSVFHKVLRALGRRVEVIYISDDRPEDIRKTLNGSFTEWLALTDDDKQSVVASLRFKLGVTKIPSLATINGKSLLHKNCPFVYDQQWCPQVQRFTRDQVTMDTFGVSKAEWDSVEEAVCKQQY